MKQLCLFPLFLSAASLVSGTTSDQDNLINKRPVHPALAAWWRGLNPDHQMARDLRDFADSLLVDSMLSKRHPGFEYACKYSDTLAFTVPTAFFAFAKGFGVIDFVTVCEDVVKNGEEASRIYALAFRLLLAGLVDSGGEKSETRLKMKQRLIDSLERLRSISGAHKNTTDRFKAYRVLFASHFASNRARSKSSLAEEEALYALEHFPTVKMSPEESICKNSEKNNVARALLFALHHASYPDKDDPCKMEGVQFPSWLYQFTDLLYGEHGFNQPLLIGEAECQKRSSVNL
jgi:hypothetical protein